LNIFEELSTSSSKFQNFQSSQYFHQIWCTHLVKFLKCRKLYFVRKILGDFNVFLSNPHILFLGSSMVISSSKCKYWVWSKNQVLTRYESRDIVCEFHIHGCEVFTPEVIPNKGWNDFGHLTHVYYNLWLMISLWMKINQIHVQFHLG
jgi:hypothetical protein